MKKILIAFLLIPLFIACEEESPVTNSEIYGTWKWVSSNGGIAGWTLTPGSTGNSEFIVIAEGGTYSKIVNDTLTLSTKFSVTEGETIYGTNPYQVMRFEEGAEDQAILNLKNDTLVLGENCYDCYVHTFTRYNSLVTCY